MSVETEEIYSNSPSELTPFKIAALYQFSDVTSPSDLKDYLTKLTTELNIRGMLMIATEGVNGTVCGSNESISTFYSRLLSEEYKKNFDRLTIKYSYNSINPFHHMRISIRKEIVTMGVDEIQPLSFLQTGSSSEENAEKNKEKEKVLKSIHRVDSEAWNRVLLDKDTIIIDTRNDYEFKFGTFHQAINPNTSNFREFPAFVDSLIKNYKPESESQTEKTSEHQAQAQPELSEAPSVEEEIKKKNIAMFCTGGIRCEKASLYMAQLGFEHVYNLEGGILKYLEDMKGKKDETKAAAEEEASKSKELTVEDNLWEGECFVFDHRVTVTKDLEKGEGVPCHACRTPLTAAEVALDSYEEGISCLYCIKDLTPQKRKRLEERNKQLKLNKDHFHNNKSQVSYKKLKVSAEKPMNEDLLTV